VFLWETAPPQASNANSQEDLEVLAFLGIEAGTFVEAGANHPVNGSQTYLLEQKGWRGVLIEPNAGLAKLCHELRPSSGALRAQQGRKSFSMRRKRCEIVGK